MSSAIQKPLSGGRFDFDDGGTYCGGWEDGKAHGNGVCTGPKGQGEYSGSWHYGFEVSGVYTWPSGSTYCGHWQNGKRHGLGIEIRGKWIYRGEWTQGMKGRYGVRQCINSNAKFEGTWASGLQDGYGSETYADGGSYQGQWLRGMRHGYGVRTSAPYSLASRIRPKNGTDCTEMDGPVSFDPGTDRERKADDVRGGFVLKSRTDEVPRKKSIVTNTAKRSIFQGLRFKKQRSLGEYEKHGIPESSVKSSESNMTWHSADSYRSAYNSVTQLSDSNGSFVSQDEIVDEDVTESYMGEWKNDKRCGFGVCERSDGLKFEGEWFNNKRYGYGVLTHKDGTKEEGKFKSNILITSQKRKRLFLIRSAKFRERIESAVNAANRAAKISLQKADIAISRTATARGKAEQSDIAALHAKEDSELAKACALRYAPDFKQGNSNPLDVLNIQTMNRHILSSMQDYLKEPVKDSSKDSIHSSNEAVTESNAFKMYGVTKNVISTQQLADNVPTHSVLFQLPNSNQSEILPPSDSYEQTKREEVYLPTVQKEYRSEFHSDRQVHSEHLQASNFPVTANAQKQIPSSSASLRAKATSKRILCKGLSLDHNHQQAMNDHFDYYRKSPSRSLSRDSSLDQYTAGYSSRCSSRHQLMPFINRENDLTKIINAGVPDKLSYGSNMLPSSMFHKKKNSENTKIIPDPMQNNFNKESPSHEISDVMTNSTESMTCSPPLSISKKRTESLCFKPLSSDTSSLKVNLTHYSARRKKSLPDSRKFADTSNLMSREEISILSSVRRQEIQRFIEEEELCRRNPIRYIFKRKTFEWLWKQKLMIVVFFINMFLAIMFIRLLT